MWSCFPSYNYVCHLWYVLWKTFYLFRLDLKVHLLDIILQKTQVLVSVSKTIGDERTLIKIKILIVDDSLNYFNNRQQYKKPITAHLRVNNTYD